MTKKIIVKSTEGHDILIECECMYICALIVAVVDIIVNPDVVWHYCGDHIGAFIFGCGND